MKTLKAKFALICALVLTLLAIGCEPPPTCECPACPTTLAAASAEVVDVEAESVATTTTEPTTTNDPWLEQIPGDLVGIKWGSRDGLPVPTLEVVANEKDSKTPFNFDIRARKPVALGCGLEVTGEAWCRVYEKANDPTEPAVEMWATFLRKGYQLEVILSERLGERAGRMLYTFDLAVVPESEGAAR